jgi:type IV pilus assembly protein PilM
MWNNIWDKISHTTVTLYIDDTSLRLLVARGQRVKKWADVRLEPGLIANSVIVQQNEVAAKIKELFKSQKVQSKRVTLGHSGLHSLTRPVVLPELNKAMLAEAVTREARRVLPIPLEQLYLSWRTYPSPKGRVNAFIAATPRKTVDSMIKTLELAGYEPSHMTIRSLALTKAMPENTALIVDLQPTEFDIIIMSDGIPQPIRTIALPNEELTWEQKLDMIAADVERTIKFFDTNNAEKPLDSRLPMIVSGELMDRSDLHESLSRKVGRPIQVFTPILKVPEQMHLGRYIVNVAMAVESTNSERQSTFPVANINLLPAPYQPKPISMAKLIGIPGTGVAAAMIIPLVMLMQNTSTSIDSLQHQIDTTNLTANQRNAQRTLMKEEIAKLEKRIAAIKTTSDSLKISLETILADQECVNNDLQLTLDNLPLDINLTSINQSGKTLTLSGSAPTQEDVHFYAQTILDYARKLDATYRFTETTISSLSISRPGEGGSDSPGSIQFTLTFERGG